MIVRMAKKGRNRGKKFYGCSRFPECKTTLPYNDASESAVTEERVSHDLALTIPDHVHESSHPRHLRARSLYRAGQARFFDTTAIPERIYSLDHASKNQIASQWRLDYPLPAFAHTVTDTEQQVLSIAEKILTRGQVTLVSPRVEARIFGLVETEFTNQRIARQGWHSAFTESVWLDSPAEERFLSSALPRILGPGAHRWVTPQIDLASLIPGEQRDTSIDGRVDFLLAHPELERSFVIEIDGEQHEEHRSRDLERDRALENAGYAVIRVPAYDADNADRYIRLVEGWPDQDGTESSKFRLDAVELSRIVHQTQLAVLQAIVSGHISIRSCGGWYISSDLHHIPGVTERLATDVLDLALRDLQELIANLGLLYGEALVEGLPRLELVSAPETEKDLGVHLAFSGQSVNANAFAIRNLYLPFRIASSAIPCSPASIQSRPPRKTLEYFLHYVFRKEAFWEGQYETIDRALRGEDSVVLLPTGAGKSIAFQLSSLLRPGIAVVVTPIISLMEDQVYNLKSVGIDRCVAISSSTGSHQGIDSILGLVGQGEYVLVYVAPERFQIQSFRDSLRALTVHTPVALVAIDEAHCVSEWGHDFRTSYLNIGRIAREYCGVGDYVPPLLALTGTASRAVLKDVQRELEIQDFNAIITPTSFDRSELSFRILHCRSSEKSAQLSGLIGQSIPSFFRASPNTFYQTRGEYTNAGIVFCPHVNGSYGVVQVATEVQGELGIGAGYYSGSTPKYHNQYGWAAEKSRTAMRYKRNELPLLVATKSFGMGIDKPNIRYTVHYGIPSSLEAFYQEAGRAGRDRNAAQCILIISNDHPARNEQLLNPETSVEDIARQLQKLSWPDNDDISRMLYFHTRAFRGVGQEKRSTTKVLQQIRKNADGGRVSLVFSDIERNTAEKGLHRLLLLGVVEDYTIDYSSDEFTIAFLNPTKDAIVDSYVQYVASYSTVRSESAKAEARQWCSLSYEEFLSKMIELLLHFIYEVVEKGRRASLREMLTAAGKGQTGEGLRIRLLQYLEETEYSEFLDLIQDAPNTGLREIINVFENDVVSARESQEIRGQVIRYLESYPDHPGYLFVRALSEALQTDRSRSTVVGNFGAALSFSQERYRIDPIERAQFVAWALDRIARQDRPLGEQMTRQTLRTHGTRDMARSMVQVFNISFAHMPALFLLDKLRERIENSIL